MITQTHDQLDNWVAIWTLITGIWGVYSATRGYINRGWREAARLEKKSLDDSIASLKAADHIQFSRIDELRTRSEGFVTRDHHDDSIKELYIAIEKSVNRLSDKIDNLIMKNK